jgi:hypothetical protein
VVGGTDEGGTKSSDGAIVDASGAGGGGGAIVEAAFLQDLNTVNPLGRQGRLAVGFGDLVRMMWSGHHKSVAPSRFKQSLGEWAPNFKGYGQQDAQELLAFLLDGLHEDLNRATPVKPTERAAPAKPVDAAANNAKKGKNAETLKIADDSAMPPPPPPGQKSMKSLQKGHRCPRLRTNRPPAKGAKDEKGGKGSRESGEGGSDAKGAKDEKDETGGEDEKAGFGGAGGAEGASSLIVTPPTKKGARVGGGEGGEEGGGGGGKKARTACLLIEFLRNIQLEHSLPALAALGATAVADLVELKGGELKGGGSNGSMKVANLGLTAEEQKRLEDAIVQWRVGRHTVPMVLPEVKTAAQTAAAVAAAVAAVDEVKDEVKDTVVCGGAALSTTNGAGGAGSMSGGLEGDGGGDGGGSTVAAEEAWKTHVARNNSFIVDHFQGQYQSQVRCPTCTHSSTTYDAFMYLSVPVLPPGSDGPDDQSKGAKGAKKVRKKDTYNLY